MPHRSDDADAWFEAITRMAASYIVYCLVVDFEDMGTKWTKAPNLVQLFFTAYKVILEGEPSPNTTLTIKP